MCCISCKMFVSCSIEGEYVPMEGDEVSYKICSIPPKYEKIQAVEVTITHLKPGTKHETWGGHVISDWTALHTGWGLGRDVEKNYMGGIWVKYSSLEMGEKKKQQHFGYFSVWISSWWCYNIGSVCSLLKITSWGKYRWALPMYNCFLAQRGCFLGWLCLCVLGELTAFLVPTLIQLSHL